MITRPREIFSADGAVSRKALESCIAEHIAKAGRLRRLRRYYDGEHDICQRVRASGLPNVRLTHAYPRYITTMASGYLVGSPISYAAADERQAGALESVRRAYDGCNADSVDAELAKQASLYGKGVELVYGDRSARPRAAAIDPCEAFVVYDDTVEHRPLFGVHYYRRTGEDGKPCGWRANVYTDRLAFTYDAIDAPTALKDMPDSVSTHYFGGVPLVEYWNNEDELGDFEPVLSLIDAYDALQSDRVNDKAQFVDALLVISGCRLDAGPAYPGDTRTVGQRLREEKAIHLPDATAKVEWLCKQLSEADVEILRNAIKADIHKLSMVPDLTDEQFAGNASGVAMRYKLMGLEMITRIKERWFREAIRTRLRLFASFFTTLGAPALDAEAVQITFTYSLPQNELEAAEMVKTLQGIVPDELLLPQLPFVSDTAAALELLGRQRGNEK